MSKHDSMPKLLIASIATGIAMAVCIAIGLTIFICHRRHQHAHRISDPFTDMERAGGNSYSLQPLSRRSAGTNTNTTGRRGRSIGPRSRPRSRSGSFTSFRSITSLWNPGRVFGGGGVSGSTSRTRLGRRRRGSADDVKYLYWEKKSIKQAQKSRSRSAESAPPLRW